MAILLNLVKSTYYMGNRQNIGVTGKILKFADYTKLFTKTKEIGDKHNYKMTLIN